MRYYIFSVEQMLQRPFLAMEFVEGRSLSAILDDDGPLPVDGLVVVPVLDSPGARHFYAAVRAGSQNDPAIALVLERLRSAADDWTAASRQQPTRWVAR